MGEACKDSLSNSVLSLGGSGKDQNFFLDSIAYMARCLGHFELPTTSILFYGHEAP